MRKPQPAPHRAPDLQKSPTEWNKKQKVDRVDKEHGAGEKQAQRALGM
jgi:hypothetical protein